MRSKLITSAAILSGLLVIIIVFGNIVIVAQKENVAGTWTARVRSSAEKHKWDDDDDLVDEIIDDDKSGEPRLQINLKRNRRNRDWSNGNSYRFSEISGLTQNQTQNGPVSFSVVREAGRVDFVGSFNNGNGSGTFTFTPDRSYFDRMQQRGFDFYKEEPAEENIVRSSFEDRALAAFFLNVTAAKADDLVAANFGSLDIDDLFKATIFKIDGKFMSEMKATGFPDLSMEDLVKARIFKIDANYVSQIRAMGYDSGDFERLVKFRIFKVTPEFLNELRSAGLTNISAEDIVKCRIFNIDADFVRKERAKDPNVTIEDLVKMRIGIGKNFLRDEF
ncbi:MAG: peptidase M56 BlaR1 [Acidobacteria bacterium OLB17]|nr:MAG: peptidase M56 BlaR1 [Acidobacteria bacterium OLB17]MCZ2390937.1 hypothetical protein [Acidobacteriota bacterium]